MVRLPKRCVYVLVLLWACGNSDTQKVAPANGTYYYPAQKGRYCIYQVQKVVYSLVNPNDSEFYQLKIVTGDTFTDLSGNISYKQARYKRFVRKKKSVLNPQDSIWRLDSLWYFRFYENQLLEYQNNVPLAVLSFPVQNGKTWNGNAYNTRGRQLFRYENVAKPFSVSGVDFSNTVSVWQKKDSNALEIRKIRCVYAENVGLIQSDWIVTDDACKFNFENKPCVPGAKVAAGTVYSQKIMLYGVE